MNELEGYLSIALHLATFLVSIFILKNKLFQHTWRIYTHKNPKDEQRRRAFDHDNPSFTIFAHKCACEIDYEVSQKVNDEGKRINLVKFKIRLSDVAWIFLNVIVLILLPLISQTDNEQLFILKKLTPLEIYFLDLVLSVLLFYIARLHFEMNLTKIKTHLEEVF